MKVTDFTMDFFSLKGKNAIVTGGNGGLGQAFSTALAKAGANVLVPSLVDDDGTTRQIVEACGVAYEFLEADITKDGECKRVVDTCVDSWGSIDILVNCAGISINVQDVTKYTRKEWDKMVAVNLTAAFEMIHEASIHMIGAEQREDHQYRLSVLLPRRPVVTCLCGDQARDRRSFQGDVR